MYKYELVVKDREGGAHRFSVLTCAGSIYVYV